MRQITHKPDLLKGFYHRFIHDIPVQLHRLLFLILPIVYNAWSFHCIKINVFLPRYKVFVMLQNFVVFEYEFEQQKKLA